MLSASTPWAMVSVPVGVAACACGAVVAVAAAATVGATVGAACGAAAGLAGALVGAGAGAVAGAAVGAAGAAGAHAASRPAPIPKARRPPRSRRSRRVSIACRLLGRAQAIAEQVRAEDRHQDCQARPNSTPPRHFEDLLAFVEHS